MRMARQRMHGLWQWTLTAAVVMAGAGQMARADSVVTWGYNYAGQLGNGGFGADRNTPGAVSALSSGVNAVAAGEYHSLALKNGGVWSWGGNPVGQLGDGSTTDRYTPVAVSGLSSGVSAIAGGYCHSLALKGGGIWAWGYNYNGQLGDGSTTNRKTPVPVSGLSSGVSAVAAGDSHSLALKDGGVWAWGGNYYGQLGDGSDTERRTPVAVSGLSSGVSAVAAGAQHNLALKDGGVWAWGVNGLGELGDGTTFLREVPVAVRDLSSGVSAVAAGDFHSLALKDGGVWAWGYNGSGQLGDGGGTFNRLTPMQVDPADLNDIVQIAASDYSSYALSADGSLWVWGSNGHGQLGLGVSGGAFATPQHLLAPAGYRFTSIDADANGSHVIATLAPVPEPAGLGLLTLGGAAVLLGRRRA